ncbi:MAG: tRNA dihydrouridine(20/20a) synthase DusA, partial [Parvibaculaceae bacterium]
RIGEAMGYDEINLNCGCPSDRVQSGCFGAALMAEPRQVAACVQAMREAVAIPVTVKCRIGIDEQDPEVALNVFVRTVAEAGCTTFVVHARKAWLKGLSPKENREIPPLDHGLVHRLKAAHPELAIVINGGIGSLDEAARHLEHVDGVMLGRAAYQNPGMLMEVDRRFFDPASAVMTPEEAVRAYMPFVERELARGARLQSLVRPLIGLFQGRPGARAFRRTLAEGSLRAGAGPELLEAALRPVERRPLPEAA